MNQTLNEFYENKLKKLRLKAAMTYGLPMLIQCFFLQKNVEVCSVEDMGEIRRPLLTQRVLPVNYFEISILVTDLKMFIKKSLSALMYTHFEGRARDKKT